MISPLVNKAAVHVLGWILFFGLILGFVIDTFGLKNILAKVFSVEFIIFCITYIFIFYFNGLFLFRKLYLQNKYFLYFLALLVILVLVFFLRPFDNLHVIHKTSALAPKPGPDPGPGHIGPRIDIISIIACVMAFFASSAIEIWREWRNTERRADRAEADKIAAELSFLKAQINPHFLFNTLNNIYSLAVSKSDDTPVSILRLSNIMRYVTEEAMDDYVSLESEVECITDYIDLQKIRLSKKVYVDFSLQGELENKKIAPLILMTFIENVFKYGISNHHQSTITIKLFVEEESITFFCQNRIFNADVVNNRKGIGIENSRRRLNVLYPGKHLLEISKEKDLFTIQLNLSLN